MPLVGASSRLPCLAHKHLPIYTYAATSSQPPPLLSANMDALLPARPARVQPGWRALAAAHWPQYLAVALLFGLLRAVDPIEPRPRFIYHKTDAELWRVREGRERGRKQERIGRQRAATSALPRPRLDSSLRPLSPLSPQYSFPYLTDTVPLWVVPLLNVALPLLVFIGAWLVRGCVPCRRSRCLCSAVPSACGTSLAGHSAALNEEPQLRLPARRRDRAQKRRRTTPAWA